MKIKKLLSLLTVAAMMLTTCSVTALAADGDVAQIGNTTYATLQAAFDAADGKKQIKLISDIDISEADTEFNKQGLTVTLDLNGKTVKAANTDAGNINVFAGKLILTDSVGTGKIYSETEYKNNAANGFGIFEVKNAEMDMQGGYIEAVCADPVNDGNFGIIAGPNSKVTVSGGKIKVGWACVSSNGSVGCGNAQINITGGELISTSDYAIYAPAINGKVNIYGGTIFGAGGAVCIRRGALNIYAGKITSDASGNLGNFKDGTSTVKVKAPITVQADYADVNANITGAIIEAPEGTDAIAVYAEKNNKATVTVTGGTFNKDVNKYVKAGLETKTNADGSIVVNPVAEMNGKYYSALQYAFDDVKSDSTIKLVSDTDISETGAKYTNSSTVTLDLNGKTVKAANTQAGNIQVLGGKLILTDGTTDGKIYSETVWKGVPTGYGVIDVNNAEFEMQGGYITSVRENAVDEGNFGIEAGTNSTVTISGGKIETGWYCVSTNGNSTNTNIVINGGTLISTVDFAIYAPASYSLLTINGGTVYGAAGGVAMRNGKLIINGGEVTSKGNGDTGNFNDGTSGMKHAAISFESKYGNIEAEIKGGKVTAPAGMDVIASVKGAKGDVDLAITGGEYSSDPLKFIDSVSYASVKGETLYTVEERKEIVSDIAVMTESSKAGENGEKIYPITIFAGLRYLDYKNAGFEITVDNEKKDDITTTTAYNKIKVGETTYDKENFGGSSYVFGAILNLKESDKTIKSLKIRPFATTQNGTKLYGEVRTVNIGENKEAAQ